MKKLTLEILLGLLPFFKGKTQEQITDFLYGLTAGTLNDTEQLIEGYMSPVGAWFGNGLNAGWYNTGKPHQFPGFDVTVGFHIITPTTDALYFSPTLESFMIDGDGELATILGPSDPTQVMYTNPINEQNENLFKIPGGLNWDGALLMPYLQGSIGLIKKTEILFLLSRE